MSNFDCDVLVIGGGISGLGAAWAAAAYGLKTVLVEKNSAGAATSANSLRIIHGGFRYLQSFDIARVRESAWEQFFLINKFPDLIKPLRCFMPISGKGLKRPLLLRIAGALYSQLARSVGVVGYAPSVLSLAQTKSVMPSLHSKFSNGALEWHDALLRNHELLLQTILRKLIESGVEIQQDTTVVEIKREKVGFRVEARQGVNVHSIHSRTVINTAGVDGLALFPTGEQRNPKLVPQGWCRGFNVVLHNQLHPEYAFGIESHDGRLFFFVPRDNGTAIGTGYVPRSLEARHDPVSSQELQEFLSNAQQALPEFAFSSSDVKAVESGILPMKSVSEKGPELYGNYWIDDSNGFIDVWSTKYTTFRSQGMKAAALARKHIKKAA